MCQVFGLYHFIWASVTGFTRAGEGPNKQRKGTFSRPPILEMKSLISEFSCRGGSEIGIVKLGNLNSQNSHINIIMSGGPVKVNKTYGWRTFKKMAGETGSLRRPVLCQFLTV